MPKVSDGFLGHHLVPTVLTVVYNFTVESVNQLLFFELFVVRDLMLLSVLLEMAQALLHGEFLF